MHDIQSSPFHESIHPFKPDPSIQRKNRIPYPHRKNTSPIAKAIERAHTVLDPITRILCNNPDE
jgi:hypothetical protein